ncbi:MAG TPA: adenylate/guanylate cyclase domain-containing protein [Nitrososphaerales archaeon]|nr:adenylate/guanylate cyclase domain-containing protein [Nitrososphaerales archaeon]
MAQKKKGQGQSSPGRRKLSAIMFTDMVGYTRLGQSNEALSLALVNQQRKLLRPIFKRHNGREVKTIGDAFLAQFPSALDAARCAYDIQRATREFNISAPEDRRLILRVGIHVGDVLESSDGDISVDAVNVASRIEPLAQPGGVCLTRQVFDHVQNKFDLSLQSLGLKTLKNVVEPIEIFKMVMPWQSEKRSEEPASQGRTGAEFDRLRIAVLPFYNMSPDPNDEYFSDGMTEELISTISRISGLSVIARTSVMSYKGYQKKIEEIARELRVGTILEGSVRKSGDKLRITAQLVNAEDSRHL